MLRGLWLKTPLLFRLLHPALPAVAAPLTMDTLVALCNGAGLFIRRRKSTAG